METGILEKKIATLPENLKMKVEGYVDALIDAENQNGVVSGPGVTYKTSRAQKPVFGSEKGIFGEMADDFDTQLEEKPKLKREFGGLKGFVTYIADDFDGPLEDFKDYM